MNNGNDVNQRDAENFEASDNESAQQNQFRNDSFTFDDDLNDDGDNTEYPEWHASSQNDNQAAGEETHFENADTQENRQAEQPAEASSAQSNADSNNRQNRFSANNLKNFLKFLVVLVVVGGGIMLATSKGDKGKTGKTGTAESEEEHEIKIGDAESAASSVANIPAFVSAPAAPASDMLPPIVVGGSEPTAAVVPQTPPANAVAVSAPAMPPAPVPASGSQPAANMQAAKENPSNSQVSQPQPLPSNVQPDKTQISSEIIAVLNKNGQPQWDMFFIANGMTDKEMQAAALQAKLEELTGKKYGLFPNDGAVTESGDVQTASTDEMQMSGDTARAVHNGRKNRVANRSRLKAKSKRRGRRNTAADAYTVKRNIPYRVRAVVFGQIWFETKNGARSYVNGDALPNGAVISDINPNTRVIKTSKGSYKIP